MVRYEKDTFTLLETQKTRLEIEAWFGLTVKRWQKHTLTQFYDVRQTWKPQDKNIVSWNLEED